MATKTYLSTTNTAGTILGTDYIVVQQKSTSGSYDANDLSSMKKTTISQICEPGAQINTVNDVQVSLNGTDYASVITNKVGRIDLSLYVKTTRKVNNKALTGDITLDGSDIDLSSGYAIATTAAAPAIGDSVDVAVGKLQKEVVDLNSGKADKISGATIGDLVTVDASGNIVDSLIAATTIAGKADKVPSATSGHITQFDVNGNIEDSGVSTSSVTGRLDTIEGKIPSQASTLNQLADKDFVNSSIATATATFRGSYNLVSDFDLPINATQAQIAAAIATYLSAHSITPDKNDYVFVQIPTDASDPTVVSRVDRYKYPDSGTTWEYEYSLNNSSFTAAQWAAINSGITSTLVGNYSTHVADTSIHVTSTDKAAWNAKYDKPSTGIPSTDMSSAVQTSLGLADTAVQPDQIPPASKITSVTIGVSEWSNSTCVKAVSGMTADYALIITPSSASSSEYAICNVRCTAQGANSLTFVCDDTPTTSLTVNILCLQPEPLSELTGLTVGGDWTNTQYTDEAVDTTGLTFTATYTSGTQLSVVPTSMIPSTWGSTAGTQTATFTYTEGGISVSGSKSASIVLNPKKKVGGTIFYIDDTADGTYTFYDAQGNVTSAPTVGTDCTNWKYEVTGATKDKFYVYNSSAMFKRDRSGTQTDPYIAWTYLDTTNQSYIDDILYDSGLPDGRTEWSYYGNKGRVYETLDGTYTGTAIGTGKSNTSNMLSLRSGVYNQSSQIRWKSQSQYSETIWYVCDQFNKGTYSLNGSPVPNNTGCNDWYIPSKDELETMKNAIGYSTFATMLDIPGASSNFITPWTSSAYSDVVQSWFWMGGHTSGGIMNRYPREAGDDIFCLALSRSF